jgi:ABC-type branched-subunit amino acid transport system substrate-binding protein
MRGRRFAPALATLALAAAACGTTVPSSQISRAQSGSSGLDGGTTSTGQPSGAGPGPTADAGDGTSGTTGGTSTGSTSTSGDGSGSAASTGVTAPGSTGSGPAVAPTAGTTARGPIKIGALTAPGAGKYQASLGFKGATGDQVAMSQSVVSWINAHGGLGGRRIQLVSYDLDPAAMSANQTQAMQAACTYFTQDNKVVAIASYVSLIPESFYQCLAKAHVPVVNPDEGVSRDFFQRFPNTLYMPSVPTYSRLLADSVDVLWNAGWLTSKSVVGVVGYDTNDVHAIVDKSLTPALQRHGLKITRGLYTSTTTSSASEYNGGVLAFNTQHVDRVFFAPGGQPIYFALAAAQQGYHPRYELGSLEYLTAIADNLPASQLSGSMGLGWLPYLDLPSTAWPSVNPPGIAECRKAMAGARQDFSSGTTLGIAAWICDDWFFLRDVFAAGATPDEGGIRRAAESLGDRFRPAATFRTSLAPGRTHDGAGAYRMVAFNDECACFRYTGPVTALP